MYDPENDTYQKAEDAFRNWTVLDESDAALLQHLHALSDKPLPGNSLQHREIIRGLTIHAELTRRHLTKIDQSNKKIQNLFLVLTVASLAAALVQIYVAVKTAPEGSLTLSPRSVRRSPGLSAPHLPSTATDAPSISKAGDTIAEPKRPLSPQPSLPAQSQRP